MSRPPPPLSICVPYCIQHTTLQPLELHTRIENSPDATHTHTHTHESVVSCRTGLLPNVRETRTQPGRVSISINTKVMVGETRVLSLAGRRFLEVRYESEDLLDGKKKKMARNVWRTRHSGLSGLAAFTYERLLQSLG